MRLFARAALCALVLGTLATGASAQEDKARPAEEVALVFRLTYWEVNDEMLARLAGKSKLSAGELSGRRLQQAEVLGLSGEDAYVGLVRRTPINYFDPRATQFQIQYVDAGVKLDVKAQLQAGQTFDIELRQELTQIVTRRQAVYDDKPAVSYPETEGFLAEARFAGVRPGDLLFLGSSASAPTRAHIKQLDPGAKAPHLIATLEVETP